jgi:exonuclease III
VKLISWNVARRNCTGRQVEKIIALQPDVLALQEVTIKSRAAFRTCLALTQLIFVIDSFDLAPDLDVLRGPRQVGELIACRWPFRALDPMDFEMPWSERVLSVIINSPLGNVELHTAHIPPGSSNGWIKVYTLEGIFHRLAVNCDTHRILCGDLNTPKEENSDGSVITWGGGRQRWDKAEWSVLKGLAEYDLEDVYRSLHGYGKTEFSHCVRGRGRRYDHVFASIAVCHPVPLPS